MHEHDRALEVAEKPRAEAVPGMRALDESGDVGQDEARVVHSHDAQVRHERREGIVRDPGACGGDGTDERRLPDVGEAEQPRVGEHPELEPQLALLRRRGGLGAPRRPVGGCREVTVAASSPAAPGDDRALARGPQIGELLARAGVVHERPGGDPQHEIASPRPVLILAAPVLPALRAQQLGIGQVEERAQPLIDEEDDVAPVAPVATARSAAGHVLLAPEARAAPAALPALNADAHLVDELHVAGGMVAEGALGLHVPPRVEGPGVNAGRASKRSP